MRSAISEEDPNIMVDVHEGAVDWLVQQGWKIVNIKYAFTIPETPLYTLTRDASD